MVDEKGRKACGHFAKTGKCNAGESCPLAHIEVEGAKGKKERCVDYFVDNRIPYYYDSDDRCYKPVARPVKPSGSGAPTSVGIGSH